MYQRKKKGGETKHMTNLKKQLFSAMTAGAVILSMGAPALASTTTEISGNGAFSDNFATINQSSDTTIRQNNDADVDNNIDVDANTGNNSASFNTGGDVEIKTGDANTSVNVQNVLNSNKAKVDCCKSEGSSVLIEDNGAFSDNVVDIENDNTIDIDQDNDADVDNDIDVDADTGNNTADFNTRGDVSIQTGDANTKVNLRTIANANSASIGNGHNRSSGSFSAKILDNGAFSDNFITADLDQDTEIDQDNDADIDNDVDVDAETGDNTASFNTRGDVEIETGDANAEVIVDNLVNFNHADVDCGCAFDALAKIDDNGAESLNVIDLTLDDTTDLDQDNDADLDNDIDVRDLETGDNFAGFNTRGDTEIETGDADSRIRIQNTANANIIGEDNPFDFLKDNHIGFSFDIEDLLDHLKLFV